MHDIKFIRENPDAFDAALKRRGFTDGAGALVHDEAQLRSITTRIEASKADINRLSKDIGAAMARGDTAEAARLKADVADLKAGIAEVDQDHAALAASVERTLLTLPNLPADDVPDGADEHDNVEVRRWGDGECSAPAQAGAQNTDAELDSGFRGNTTLATPREHFDIGAPLGLDFESAQSVAGARFAYLRGGVARLSRALGQFMLDMHVEQHGYLEVNPPLLVREHAMFGTAQLPKFAEDSFKTTDDRWLISTSEISLTNLAREQIVTEAELPLRFTALTPCFRSEAGAAGKDTRGLIRQHQFEKVELVSITRPEDSDGEHERMTASAEAVLEALNLPYRRMLLCAGDMGFAARKTYDLEVWLPGQGQYREISSCSNCGDFQARRMNARFRRAGEKAKPEFVHTLNGSGVAVGRALVAVLENYQNADGSVRVPDVLHPYMRGQTVLMP